MEKCGCSQLNVKNGDRLSTDTQGNSKPSSSPPVETDEVLVENLKALLKKHFKSKKEAFDKLGGSDDGRIDKDELSQFLGNDIGFTGDVSRVFTLLDTDGDGHITRKEFLEFGKLKEDEKVRDGSKECVKNDAASRRASVSEDLAGFRDFLKKQFKGAKEAFAQLDINDDKGLELEEFRTILQHNFKDFQGDVDKIFFALDEDGDGTVSFKEFKTMLVETSKRDSVAGERKGSVSGAAPSTSMERRGSKQEQSPQNLQRRSSREDVSAKDNSSPVAKADPKMKSGKTKELKEEDKKKPKRRSSV